ncbi:hypothetical protein MPER_00254, partial [Moniliophthora perniciosa FA553]
MNVFNSIGRSMGRAPRAPKRSPTPTPFVEAALVKGNFRTIVMLPKYVDIMEWVAVN